MKYHRYLNSPSGDTKNTVETFHAPFEVRDSLAAAPKQITVKATALRMDLFKLVIEFSLAFLMRVSASINECGFS